MKTRKNLLSLAALTGTLATLAIGAGPGNGNSTDRINETPEYAMTMDFLAAWSRGLSTADVDRNGGVDGGDLQLYFLSLAHPRNRADMDGNGSIDASDMAKFFTLYSESDPAADLNMDGSVEGGDIEEWFLSSRSLDLITGTWVQIFEPDKDQPTVNNDTGPKAEP